MLEFLKKLFRPHPAERPADLSDQRQAEPKLPLSVELQAEETTGRLPRGEDSELKDEAPRTDEFLALLAHELSNSLAPLQNALQLMQMPTATPEAIEEARQISARQLNQLTRLVDDLLDVSRIMRGRIELRKQAVDLATVMRTAVETVQPVLDAQGQELVISMPLGPLKLDVDPARLTQVIGNLLHNAATFSPKGSKIWLSAERDGGQAVLTVKDQGVGIPSNMLGRIFDLFTQVDRPERSTSGLGIGLTLVRRLVELHGGTVEAHSEGAGKGSEFIVRLPLLAEPALPADKPRSPNQAAAAVPPRRRRILMVDDNQEAVNSLARLLRMLGHEVHTAYDGLQGVDKAAKVKPDIVLLDIGMPGLNGFDTARKIREHPWSADMTLIALTGFDQEDYRRRSTEAGFDHHLVKPVGLKELEKLLT